MVVNNKNEYAAGFAWRRSDRITKRGSWLRDLVVALATALAATLLFMAGDAYAQDRVIQISGNTHTAMVSVTIGKSQDVRTDTSFVDVMVGDPEVADVNPLTDHTLSILGKKIGTTRVQVYSEGKKLIGIFDVEVQYDISRLVNELKRQFPGSHLRASSVNGRIMLSGEAVDAATLDKAVTIARQFSPEIINSVSVMSPQQVMLEVRFIEISRTAGRELGVQWNMFNRNAVVNVGSQQPASNLPITTSAGEVAAGVLSGAFAVRLCDRPHPQRQHHDRRGDQCARAEGHRPQSGRAQPGRALGRHRELPGRRRISDSGGRHARTDHGRLQEIRCRSCLYADRAQPRPDQPEDRAGSERRSTRRIP